MNRPDRLSIPVGQVLGGDIAAHKARIVSHPRYGARVAESCKTAYSARGPAASRPSPVLTPALRRRLMLKSQPGGRRQDAAARFPRRNDAGELASTEPPPTTAISDPLPADRRNPVSRLLSTLATIWRLARPYFFSEDRWAGRLLLGTVIAIELRSSPSTSCSISGTTASTTRCRSATGTASSRADVLLCAGDGLHRARGLSALSQSMAADPLAALDDAALSRPLARRRQPLSHAAPRRCRRQPRPAHRRGHQAVRRPHALRSASDCSARSSRWCPSWSSCGRSRRPPRSSCSARLRHSGLSGLGGAALCGRRHHAHASRSAGRWSRSISASSGSRPTSASTWCACGRIPSRSRCSEARPPSASGCSIASVASSAISC